MRAATWVGSRLFVHLGVVSSLGAAGQVNFQVQTGPVRMDIESVSQSIEVDKGCIMATITPVSTATTILSISAVQIHHRFERRHYIKRI